MLQPEQKSGEAWHDTDIYKLLKKSEIPGQGVPRLGRVFTL